jgi:hypothetical protein
MNVLTLVAVIALAAAVSCSASGDGGPGGRRLDISKLINLGNGRTRQPISYPCRFDCKQLITKSTGQPLFSTCQDSIVSYGGDYFGKSATPGFDIDFQCFTPETYKDYFASRGKIANLINICQDRNHRCRRPLNRQFDTSSAQNYAGIPNLATLAVKTTVKYYQWYSLFSSMKFVNNVVRCPASYRPSRTRRNSCNCDLINFPELFSVANPKMPTTTSNGFVTAANVPTPVSPYTSYVNGFLGQYNNINPSPSVEGVLSQLVSQARQVTPAISYPVVLSCIDDDVDITDECDDDL